MVRPSVVKFDAGDRGIPVTNPALFKSTAPRERGGLLDPGADRRTGLMELLAESDNAQEVFVIFR